MRTFYAGSTHVAYMQFSVESGFDDSIGDRLAAGDGQVNGLCGAAQPGLLHLTTGLHTGEVPVVVELHDHRPPVGDSWADVVEVSFMPQAPRTFVFGWAGGSSASFGPAVGGSKSRSGQSSPPVGRFAGRCSGREAGPCAR